MHEFSSSYKEFLFISKSWLGECAFCGSLLMQHQRFGWRSDFDRCFCFGDVRVASLLSFLLVALAFWRLQGWCSKDQYASACSLQPIPRQDSPFFLPLVGSYKSGDFFPTVDSQCRLSYGVHIPTPLCN